MAVIIGRAQRFTENTPYPVALVWHERRHLGHTLRLWAAVFASNIAGAFFSSLLATKSAARAASIIQQLVDLGTDAVSAWGAHWFWSGVIGGWLIALVAWVVTASQWTIGQLAMVRLLTFVLAMGKFAHCMVTSSEILSPVMTEAVSLSAYLHCHLPATLGNIAGGVVIVSLLNYGQVREA
jgi:formate/nitrite transporter FocA (FNT family)